MLRKVMRSKCRIQNAECRIMFANATAIKFPNGNALKFSCENALKYFALLVRIKVQRVGRKPSSVTTLSKDINYYISL